jgi:hypothetical protein
MNSAQIAAATTAELVAFYNAHAATPVKKFADRKTAERRVAALMADMIATSKAAIPAPEKAHKEPAPKAPSKKAAKAESKAQRAAVIAERLSTGHCPLCGGDPSSQTANGEDGTAKGDNENFCHECSGAYDRATGAKRKPFNAPASNAQRAASIAASWADEAVRAARSSRIHISVNGQEFKSVGAAFRTLRLPLAKHIAFRASLRAAGSATFEHDGKKFNFVVTSIDD